MTSLFGKLRSGNDAKSPNAGPLPAKKDPNAPQPTPLERMLENAGPIRNDGSDKFFGMENFGNTCYCNSILQCLYYTPPFRENILSYPQRSSPGILAAAAATAIPRPQYRLQNGVLTRPGQAPPVKTVITPAQQPGQSRPDDKDSPEYKKKQAIATGPIVNMTYQNAASYEMPETIFTSLKDIFEAIAAEKNRHGVVSPGRFLDVLKRDNESFRGAMHQDAHEFLNFVLNTAIDSIEDHEKKQSSNTDKQETTEMTAKPESSVVSWPPTLPITADSKTKWLRDMFEGTSTSETRCLTCETVSQRDEPFLDLSVDLDQHSSITSCLNRFSEEEMLCERNKFHCDNCGGLQEAEKRMKLKRLPQILALHLKRFKYTEDFGRLQKLHHKVVYPYHLRLFNTTDDAEDPDRLYELYAVVVHIGGGPYHGHYVSIVKTQDRGWLLFDDEMVEPVDRSYVKNFFGDKSGLATAYVLFYRRTTDDEVRREQQMEGRRRASQDIVNPVTAKAKESAEMHRVYSSSPPLSPLDTGVTFLNLDHATTAPQLSPIQSNGTSRTIETPKSPVAGLTSPTSPLQSKKEKAKEEKERKAAEKAADKERERVEKARKKEVEELEKAKRKELDTKMKEAQKRQVEDVKASAEAPKAVKMDEEHKNGVHNVGISGDIDKDSASPVTTQPNGMTNGLSGKDLFRRSKSFKFASLGRRDKSALTNTEEGVVGNTTGDEADGGNGIGKEKEKKSRFGMRKNSFKIL